ncbi:unnamed protein product [Boreogadus saida]
MPGMTCGETVAKTSSLSTNDTQLVHSVSGLLPSHSVNPPRVPTLRREEATLLSQAEQAGHASANDTHTQPFRAELPMGCEEDSSPRSGGRGSSVAQCDVFGGRAGFSCNESTALTAEDGDAVVYPPPLFPGSVVTALSIMRLLGMMSAGHTVVPLGLLHMRRLQR